MFSQDGGALLLLLVPVLPATDGTINHRRLSVNGKRKEREGGGGEPRMLEKLESKGIGVYAG